jgi:2-C-methyl-D-erythritol 4-phosphate cytidylyltransferase
MNTFIITAGGIGKRMGSKIPKQFIALAGKPILMRTIAVFYEYDRAAQIIVTLPKDWWPFWKELCVKHHFTIDHEIVEGGKERFHSIKNALIMTKGRIIGIHDGVRPLVSKECIDRTVHAAINYGAGVPVLPVKESMRQGDFSNSRALNRDSIFAVQTPQCFQKDILVSSYSADYISAFTDDASVVENSGYKVKLVEGNEENIKITTPSDLRIAEVFNED